MEITDLTDEILSDDYEEGEILDEDTLYDNVSSLEEFSASDTELKSYGEINSVVFKKSLSTDGRKEKHHRRKEHKCKEDSICRKERSGKHCYARIRKSKFTAEAVEKAKIMDVVDNQGHEIQKKKSVAIPLIHAATTKYSRHIPLQKDLHEKENRCGHKYLRYYDHPKLGTSRIEKRQFSEKLKKHLTNESSSRAHENRKRARSQSPKLFLRSQIKELSIPRGTTSLLKRLVGSGSIGLKTHKDVEEVKKTQTTSVIEVNEDSIKEAEAVHCRLFESGSINSQNVIDHQLPFGSTNEKIPEDELPVATTQNNFIEDSEGVAESEIKIDSSLSNSLTLEHSANEIVIEITSSTKENSGEISNDKSGDNQNIVNTDEKEEIITTQDEITHNNEQDINDDINELHLRLEALRTAMLRKHKERKKKGFICRKKSTAEDDSFAEYILSHIDRDNSIAHQSEASETIGQTSYSCEQSEVNKILVSNEMVFNQEDNDCQIERNILLENCSYSSNNYTVHSNFTRDQDLSPVFLPNEPQLLSENTNFMQNQNLINGTNENSVEKETVEEKHCLKEINSNDVPFTGRNKRVRKSSGRFNGRRKDVLYNKKLYSKSILKKKLERRDYKRRRRESIGRDLKVISADKEEINNEDESDEEKALRELALKSVKEREKPKNLDLTLSFQEKSQINSNIITEINDGNMFSNLHIEIDGNTNINPLISGDSETTNVSSSLSLWDEIDEDILRAQLLSSLSSKIPSKVAESSVAGTRFSKKKQVRAFRRNKSLEHPENRTKQASQKLNKENFKKNSKIKADTSKRKILRGANNFRKKTASIQVGRQTTQEVPIVPKFIISLTEDSSSDDEENPSSVKMQDADVVKCIDLFLQEARIENDLKKGLLSQESELVPKQCDSNNPIKENEKKESFPDITSSTPQVLKHLPAWQQEEYRRLKKQIAEKERLLKAAKEKVLFPYEADEIIKETTLPQNITLNDELEGVGTAKFVSEVPNCGENKTEEGLQNINLSEGIKETADNDKNEIKSLGEDEQQKNKTPSFKSLLLPHTNNKNYRLEEEINSMAKCVEHLEKEMESFRRINTEIMQKKKELLLAKLNMAKKKNILFEIKKKLISKEKVIQGKIEQHTSDIKVIKAEQNDFTKQARRDLELCKLRMREFTLKTKKIFDEIDFSGSTKSLQTSVGISSTEKPRLSSKAIQSKNLHRRNFKPINVNQQQKPFCTTEKTKKLIREQPLQKGDPESEAEKQPVVNWDPFVPVCPFDLSGVCKDEECKFQHIKAS